MNDPNEAGHRRNKGAMELDALIDGALADQAFLGIACGLWIDGKEGYLRYAGCIEEGATAAIVGPDTLFDAASLTKPLATAPLVLSARDSGALELAAPIGRYLPAINCAAANLPVETLLSHTSGLPAIPAIECAFSDAASPEGKSTIDREKAVAMLLSIEPECPVGESVLYSCTGYMLLGLILERISGQSIGSLYRTTLAAPLGLPRACFASGLGLDGRPALVDGAAPTEYCAWRGRRIRGQVHDESAYCFAGQAGNAGLFVSLDDVRLTAMAYLGGGGHSDAGREGSDVHRPCSPRSLRDLAEDRTPGLNEARMLGFRLNDGTTFMGPLWSASSYGHTGFTGTSLAIWPERRMVAAVLTNRVYFGREQTLQKMADFRMAFHTIAAQRFV